MNDELDPIYFRALLLISQFNDKFLELASLLRNLQETDPVWFKTLTKIPQLGRRKAYYLIEIDRAYGGLNLPTPRLNKIGWTKLQLMAAYVTGENVEQLPKLAETHTAFNLRTIMHGKEPIINGRSVLLQFTRKQFKAFCKAILAHGAVKNGNGFVDKEEALVKALKKNKE